MAIPLPIWAIKYIPLAKALLPRAWSCVRDWNARRTASSDKARRRAIADAMHDDAAERTGTEYNKQQRGKI